MTDTAIYDRLVAELGEPNFDPAPDWEVIVAQAVLALAETSTPLDFGWMSLAPETQAAVEAAAACACRAHPCRCDATAGTR